VENELSALPRLAREKAEQAALAQDAERALEEQLQQRLGSTKPVTLTFTPDRRPKP
jgi:ribosome-binding factor A